MMQKTDHRVRMSEKQNDDKMICLTFKVGGFILLLPFFPSIQYVYLVMYVSSQFILFPFSVSSGPNNSGRQQHEH